MGNENNGRWWEFNLVRYLLGTIVGTIIANILAIKFFPLPIVDYIQETDIISKIRTFKEWQFIFIHLAVGFVFCYVTSAPILVFHSIRLNFRSTFKLDLKNKFFYIIIVIILFTFCCFSDCKNLKHNEKIALFIFFSIVFIQIYLFITHIDKSTPHNYHLLTLRRDSAVSRKKGTYIESYKHLREHGNAFFIVFLEIILGAILYQIENIDTILVLITIWIMPGAAIWFFGNYLEKKLY